MSDDIRKLADYATRDVTRNALDRVLATAHAPAPTGDGKKCGRHFVSGQGIMTICGDAPAPTGNFWSCPHISYNVAKCPHCPENTAPTGDEKNELDEATVDGAVRSLANASPLLSTEADAPAPAACTCEILDTDPPFRVYCAAHAPDNTVAYRKSDGTWWYANPAIEAVAAAARAEERKAIVTFLRRCRLGEIADEVAVVDLTSLTPGAK